MSGASAPVRARAGGAFLEAVGDGAVSDGVDGGFRIRVIRAGLSGNDNYYPDAALREAVPLFERARVLVKSDREHLTGGGKDVRNLLGDLRAAAFIPGAERDGGEIQARLRLIEPDGALAVKLREALKRGMADLFGFSINARARVRTHRRGGRTVCEAVAFDKVNSVDLIVEPGAGGELIGLLEAKKDTIMDRQQIIELLNARGLLTDRDAAQISDETLLEILTQAVGARDAAPEPGADQPPTAPAPTAQGAGGATGGETGAAQTPAAPNATGAPGAAPAEAAAVAEAVKRVEARAEMRAQVQASPLPAAAKTRVITGLEASGELTSATVTEAIRAEAEYLGQFAPSGAVRGLGADLARGGSAATLVESRGEKVAAMLEAFFDPQHKDHRHARSFRACYAAITGDERITGRLDACDRGLMTEALDSDSFSNVLGESITRRMVADYRAGSSYDVWRQLASVVPIQDFRT